MKKLLLLFLTVLTINVHTVYAQQDAAIISEWLAPLMAAMKGLDETTGTNIGEMKEAVQKGISVATDVISTLETVTTLPELTSVVKEIYTSYLEGLKALYENSIYLTDAQLDAHLQYLKAAAFNDKNASVISLDGIAGGALKTFTENLSNMKKAGTSNIKELNDLINQLKADINECKQMITLVNKYNNACIYKAKMDMGVYDFDATLKRFKEAYNIK